MKKRITALGLGLSLILGQMGMPAVNASTLHSVPVDLSGYYNIKQIYADSAPSTGYTNAGSEGGGKSWYYGQNFKDNTTVGWTKSWSEVSGDINTLTSQGVEFQLKVSTDTDEAVAVAHLTNEAGWKDIDLTDAKYSSLEFLMTFAMSGDKWRNAEIRLNYTDNSVEYKEIKPLKMTEESNSDATTAKGKITLKGASNKTEEHDGDAYIHHYSIATNPEKVLGSISLLSYNYDYTKDASGNIEYEEDGKTAKLTSLGSSNASATKDKNIYAITGMLTSDEFDKIQPVYKPIALDYNVKVFKDTKQSTSTDGWGAFSSKKGNIYATMFKTNTNTTTLTNITTVSWKNSWDPDGDGTDSLKNTFTYPGSPVEFEVQVDPTGTKPGAFLSNTGNVSVTDTNGAQWSTIDVGNMKYKSVDFLAKGTTTGNTYTSVGIRLKYTDNSEEIVEFTNGTTGIKDTTATQPSDAIGKITLAGTNGGSTDNTVNIFHYSVPADETKVLDKIDVLNYGQTLTFTDGVVTGVTGSAGANYQGGIIFAMTGVTTLAEEKKRQDEIADNMPVYKPITLNYNVTNIYNDDDTYNGGNAYGDGSGGTIYATKFKENTDIAWKTPWTTGMEENTLTANNVEFKMKIAAGIDAEPSGLSSIVSALDDDSNWMTIDVDNMKYTSVDFLASFALATDSWGTTSFKLNYTDGTSSIHEYKDIKKLIASAPSADAVGSILVDARLDSSDRDGLISHYSIPADNQKVLDNIQMLAYNYDLTDNGDGTYTETSLGGGTAVRATIIYAMTGVTTVKEEVYMIEGAKKVYNDEADTVTVTGTVRKSPTIAPRAYLAFYIDGKLTGIEDISGATTLNHTFTNATKDGTVKYFVWNQGMKPYKDSREITAQ